MLAMAVNLLASVPSSIFTARIAKGTGTGTGKGPNPNRFSHVLRAPKFFAAANGNSDQKIVRRSANYHPPIWEYDYIQSLKSDILGESRCKERASKLVGEVRMMMGNVMDTLEKLELVDTLQRLGLYYHFQHETKRVLDSVWADDQSPWTKDSLYATSLEFRLLRQHGYKVTQEVFSSFMDEMGNFKCDLCEDYKALLSLYEASYLSLEGEFMLDKARDFAAQHLKDKKILDEYLSKLVNHALELPLHWRISRLEARWFVDVYETRENRNPILLELAKLDFNYVQAVHQDDLRYTSKWWKNIGLGEKLTFSRDRLMENFLWTVGVAPDPQFGEGRRILTKVNALITTIDDVYDVYGTLDELELFTEAVERWEINAMELLPEYMKICFLALFNSINEMGFDTLKEQGIHTIPLLKKMWAELCKAYLVEAKWYYSGYIPTFKEYIDNAWISIAAPVILSHAYVLTNSTRKEMINLECLNLECLKEHSNIIYCAAMILRLANDLATSSDELKRGDVLKSIQCYMNETGSSEEEARQHIKILIDATWKKMNKDLTAHSPFFHTFIETAFNLARMALCIYQHGDGHGVEYKETKDRVSLLLVLPIALE